MKPFRERNPVIIGAVSLTVLALLLLAAFRAQDLPLIGGGDTYYATFAEAGGLKAKDEVRIAGVRVGEVEDLELKNGAVDVTFRIKTDAAFGDETRADIQVKTLLGSMYLSLVPDGGGQLATGSTIPIERTSSPFDVVDAFSGLAETIGPNTDVGIDTDQLAQSLTVLADLTRNTPRGVQGRPEGGLGAVEQHRRPRRRDQLAAEEPQAGLVGALRPRPGHRRADEGLRRAVPRPRGPPPADPQRAGLHLDPVDRAHHTGAAESRTT